MNEEKDNMAFKSEVFIDSPINKVFDILTDFTNSSSIMEQVISTEKITAGPIRKGTKLKEIRRIKKKEVEIILTVSEFIPNQKYSVISESNGILVEYHYTFIEEENGTLLQFEGNVHTKGIINFMLKPVIISVLKKEDGDHLDKLKKVIEERNGLPL
jgi:hypothetical protein